MAGIPAPERPSCQAIQGDPFETKRLLERLLRLDVRYEHATRGRHIDPESPGSSRRHEHSSAAKHFGLSRGHRSLATRLGEPSARELWSAPLANLAVLRRTDSCLPSRATSPFQG